MWKNMLAGARKFFRLYGGRIAYYGGVALALTAIALAAEHYRGDGDELILPEADVRAAVLRVPAQEQTFVPEGMELIRVYSAQPEWNRELGQWETHEACDYRLADDAVLCLQAGTVETIGESGVNGGFVEVRAGGRLFLYASILPDNKLSVGKNVRAGEKLGSADASMAGEQHLGAHLHLEVYEDGQSADYEALRAKNVQ